jgi:hypothetical protein
MLARSHPAPSWSGIGLPAAREADLLARWHGADRHRVLTAS